MVKVYLHTSTFEKVVTDSTYQSYYLSDFNKIIVSNKLEFYISDLVLNEINDIKDENIRNNILGIIEKHTNIKTINIEENKKKEINLLAEKYVSKGLIPKEKMTSSYHVAFSAIYQMGIFISWLFPPWDYNDLLNNINKINNEFGYKYPYEIDTPAQLIDLTNGYRKKILKLIECTSIEIS
jgi:hypothetical protein